jgi:hypothetical protein
MSHHAQQLFVESVKTSFPEFFTKRRVLEIGSLDLNGSIRSYFSNCEYIGVDLAAGAGVDVIGSGHELVYPDGSFDVVASCECFEHNKFWKETFENMCRMASGLVFFTCASHARPEHGTRLSEPESSPFTNDYYHNLGRDDFNITELDSWFSKWDFSGAPLTLPGASPTKLQWMKIQGLWSGSDADADLYFWGLRK